MSEFGDISKMKVPELKAALKDRGLPVSGAKQVKSDGASSCTKRSNQDISKIR